MREEDFRRYLDRWDSIAFEDPQSGRRHAEIALGKVRKLGNPALLARALTIHGSACRAAADLETAEVSFRRAQELYTELGGTRRDFVLDEADLWRRISYLRTQQQRFSAALELAGQAIRVYSAAGEKHELGRALEAKALAQLERQDPAAIGTLSRALLFLDAKRNPNAHYAASYNLVFALYRFQAEPEALESALADLADSRLSKSARRPKQHARHGRQVLGRRRATVPDAMTRLLQGRIRALLEQHDDARRLLESAREDLLSLGMPFETATASLELADCHLRMSAQPRWDLIEGLAHQALELLSPVPETAKALDAWRLLLRAAGARSLDAACRELRTARLHMLGRGRR